MPPQAKVLKLLRDDARKWWYFQTLRKQGQIDKARKLERESIRENVKEIRELREYLEEIHVRTWSLTFHRQPGTSSTVCIGGCHGGFFAAFIYCYANRIGKGKNGGLK